MAAIEEDGPLLVIGVNRPDAHNLWDLEVIQTVCRACRRLADSDHLRVGVIYGHGRLFTAGFDLGSVGPLVATGDTSAVLPDDGFHPWNFFGELCPKPLVVAVHGTCNTLGIELALARAAELASRDAAVQMLLEWNRTVLGSRDAAEGLSASLERRATVFEGRGGVADRENDLCRQRNADSCGPL